MMTRSDGTRSGLNEVGTLGLEAFAVRQSAEYAAAKGRRLLDGEAWDFKGALAPDIFTSEGPETARAIPVSRLAGMVAVGIIIVDGPEANNLQFTQVLTP